MHRHELRSFRPALRLALCSLALASADSLCAQGAAPPSEAPVSVEGCVPAPPPPRRLQVGTCYLSSLDHQDDSVTGVSEVKYEDYILPLAAGEAVRIDLDSLPAPPSSDPAAIEVEFGFDAYLEIRAPGEEDPLESNDDRVDSLNSTLLFVAPRRATYTVRATSFSGGTGDYVLRVGVARAPPLPDPLAGNVSGRLSPEDMGSEWADPTARGARYEIEGLAGERVRIRLVSQIPDAFLAIYDPSGRRIGSVSAATGSAALVAVLPQAARYLVQLTAAGLTEAGDYRLELDRAPAAATTMVPIRVEAGATLRGALTLDSPVRFDPRLPAISYFFQLYELPVEEGQVVIVEMESGAFTPVLEAGIVSVLGFATAVEAVGLLGREGTRTAGMRTNARLELRPERSGVIHLRARSRGLALGPFTLAVSSAPTE